MFATPTVKQSGTSLHVTHGEDNNLYVEFSMEAVEQTHESKLQNRPIFKDVPHILILFPGDKTKKIFRPVKDEDKFRFPRHWQAFENQSAQTIEGTPVTEWSPLSKSEALEYKAMNVHTVEMLSNLSDTQLQNLPLGARARRDQAKAWLAKATDGAALSKISAENSDLRMEIERLKQMFAQFGKTTETQTETIETAPKKRGPKPKQKEE